MNRCQIPVARLQVIQKELFRDLLQADETGDALLRAISSNAYSNSVRRLVELCGPEAHCKEVDIKMWTAFCELYMYYERVQPSGIWRVVDVCEYMQAVGKKDLNL